MNDQFMFIVLRESGNDDMWSTSAHLVIMGLFALGVAALMTSALVIEELSCVHCGQANP